MNKMMIVCNVTLGGVTKLRVVTLASNADPGVVVKQMPGAGKPYLAFSSLPAQPSGADLSDAPVVSANVAQNNAAIAAMLEDREGMIARLTFPSDVDLLADQA